MISYGQPQLPDQAADGLRKTARYVDAIFEQALDDAERLLTYAGILIVLLVGVFILDKIFVAIFDGGTEGDDCE